MSLFHLGTQRIDLREALLDQDVLYVGGGSLLNLLAAWRAHGADAILREAWEQGVVLCGISAGSMCWFEAGLTTSFGAPRPVRALGLLPGSNSVHHDGAGLLFAGRDLVEVVSARPDAGAYQVEETRGDVVERPLEMTALPSRDELKPSTPLSIAELREARAQRLERGGRHHGRR